MAMLLLETEVEVLCRVFDGETTAPVACVEVDNAPSEEDGNMTSVVVCVMVAGGMFGESEVGIDDVVVSCPFPVVVVHWQGNPQHQCPGLQRVKDGQKEKGMECPRSSGPAAKSTAISKTC